jgi:hypothetical protein
MSFRPEKIALTALATWIEQPAVPGERRRHARVKVALPGRFMRANRREFECMTRDMSPGGASFEAQEAVEVGERIVAYLDQLGRLEGKVVREFEGGFAIAMKLPPSKRERLADQLTWLANRHSLGLPEDRRHERIRPSHSRTTLIFPHGREVPATIVDLSQSGVALSLSSPVTTTVGMAVTVGSTQGRIVRLLQNGVAVEFSRVIPEADFSGDMTL